MLFRSNVSPDQIIDPPAYVVVPALQAMSYSMDSDELRSMYANLIAKSMIIDSKDLVHPGFVDDIKQMAPYDAVLLRLIASRPNNPLVDVKFVTKGLEFHPVKEKVMYFDNPLFDESRTPIALDNLIRLGIVSIPFGDHYVDDAHYAPLVVNKYGLPSKSDDKSAPHIEFDKKIVKITNYGKLFCQICIS